MKHEGRLLGIDFGTKRIGVAISDEKGGMAFPVSVIKNDNRAISAVAEIARKNNVKCIVFGESKDFLMKDNPLMEDIKEFEAALYQETSIDMAYEPEFLTSHQAQHIQGKNDMIDASAATIILQSYLDRMRNNS